MRYTTNAKTVLALETSCDESAVAILRSERGKFKLLANKIASQAVQHSNWGGVVPEIASRMHLEALPFLIDAAFSEFGASFENIDAVAATVAPGLVGALLVGSVTGRSLAELYGVPFLGVHHLEGHLASVLLSESPPEPPYLVLLVSGGHTELIQVNKYCEYNRLGRSHDDSAGEAFDKVARLLGLPYPGGPAIQAVAEFGNIKRFSLPKGKVSNPQGGFYPYDFSFSGLKTAMLRQVQALNSERSDLPVKDLAASFENVVAEVLVERSLRCAIDQDLDKLVIVGGVAANKRLRRMMLEQASLKGVQVYLAPLEFCTDNAAMIGAAALMRLELSWKRSSIELGVSARLPLEEANSIYLRQPPF